MEVVEILSFFSSSSSTKALELSLVLFILVPSYFAPEYLFTRGCPTSTTFIYPLPSLDVIRLEKTSMG